MNMDINSYIHTVFTKIYSTLLVILIVMPLQNGSKHLIGNTITWNGIFSVLNCNVINSFATPVYKQEKFTGSVGQTYY